MNWKARLTISALALVVLLTRFRQKSEPIDQHLLDFFSWAKTVDSFKAESELFEQDKDDPYGRSVFWFDGNNWEMSLEDSGQQQADLKVINGVAYVKDPKTAGFWQSQDGPQLTSAIDFRVWAKAASARLKAIKFVRLQQEVCRETACLKYLVVDPRYRSGRENIIQLIWLQPDSSELIKQEFVGETGRSLTFYSSFNQVELAMPDKAQVKAGDDSAFLLLTR